MSVNELKLFRAFVASSSRYLEFGSGGSTCLAASLVEESVTSIDSSAEWAGKVTKYCAGKPEWVQPTLITIDIGSTREWGAPSDVKARARWPAYHQQIWNQKDQSVADIYMVDGRFRVACFMQILLHGAKDSVIIIHDFNVRDKYQEIKTVAREIASADSLSVFQRYHIQNDKRIQEILDSHTFDYL